MKSMATAAAGVDTCYKGMSRNESGEPIPTINYAVSFSKYIIFMMKLYF